MLWIQQGKHNTYPPILGYDHFLLREIKCKMTLKEQEWVIQVESEKSFPRKGTANPEARS